MWRGEAQPKLQCVGSQGLPAATVLPPYISSADSAVVTWPTCSGVSWSQEGAL